MVQRIYLFPGQGSQKVGMAADLVAQYPIARQTFEQAADVLGFDLLSLCVNGPEDYLRLTQNAQPALLAHSIAALRVLSQETHLTPDTKDLVAGHSLGEYSALVANGVLEFTDALALVRIRGEAMIAAVPSGQGAMAAIVGANLEQVNELCENTRGIVVPANLNGGGQIVISGEVQAVENAIAGAKEIGAKRAVLLPVSGPFHSPLMQPAAERMEEALSDITFNAPKMPLIANVTAALETDPQRIKKLLVQQVIAPVRWSDSMNLMTSLGITHGVEVGSGKVLQGLLKRGAKDIQVILAGTATDIEAIQASQN